MTEHRQATVFDVAKEAGVSTATVSNVLNRRNVPLSKETIRKVEEAAARLGYRRNGMAASLSQRKTYELGLLLPSLFGYYGLFAEQMERTAYAYGYHLSVFSTDMDSKIERRLLEKLLERRVDGVFSHGLAMSSDSVRKIVNDGTPILFFNCWNEAKDMAIGTVNLNVYQATLDAVVHLRSQGCRSIYYYGYRKAFATNEQRKMGFCDGLRLVGEGLRSGMIDADDLPPESLPGWLAEQSAGAEPAGVVCFDDWKAFVCLNRLMEHGYAVPGRFKVVGINNEFIAEHSYPGLSSFSIPYELHADISFRWMLTHLGEQAKLAADGEADFPPPQSGGVLKIPLTLVERLSSARSDSGAIVAVQG
ncbi:LacI family DNA-binding transcriptional regulator [Paenibacillus oceani]|uniref:LacI family DNA-binding transcriptional regulator n=1 Tax=Paenibacillus oceani TaxID=2772510 RepID=A0A927C8I7_9BACL|nr:LacI family DNA-binding transcriptional regulator [Paenibacillus oceani]MBD2863353.1 LacI family DNA-binding transcriptional regulator [Paenibacillus oceani]